MVTSRFVVHTSPITVGFISTWLINVQTIKLGNANPPYFKTETMLTEFDSKSKIVENT
jgi:hypothetical protein